MHRTRPVLRRPLQEKTTKCRSTFWQVGVDGCAQGSSSISFAWLHSFGGGLCVQVVVEHHDDGVHDAWPYCYEVEEQECDAIMRT